MTSEIRIEGRDYRGCERASLKLAPIALVAGRNAQGKSSLAQGVGAVLCGDVTPVAGVTKSAAAQLVKTGAEHGYIAIQGESGTARIDWPGCQVRANGEPPAASVYAAGLQSIVTLPAKDRARIFGSYLHAAPDRADLAAAMADIGLGADAVTAIWRIIEDKGWDGAHQVRRDRGVELKARWRQVTGRDYGSRIGAAWRPDLDDDEANENDLLAALARAKHEHETAIGAAAVSSAERDRLAAGATKLDPAKDLLRGAEQFAEGVAGRLDEAKAARAALPPGNVDPGMACPHCGAFVVLRRVNLAETRLEAAEAAPIATELKKRRDAIAEADGNVSRLTGEVAEANRAVETARHALQNAAEADNYLKALPPAVGAGGDVATAKTALDRAEKRLAGFRAKREADDLHERIVTNEAVLELLAPDGLRARKLLHVLDAFNRTLAAHSEAADWRAVTVSFDMAAAYDGRPYGLCSTSEQYRVRAVLQVAMADLDHSAMVVLDAADVLDGPTRSGLFALLVAVDMPALVCMTLSRREQVPDLAAAELGASYWIEGGVAQPLHELAEAAA